MKQGSLQKKVASLYTKANAIEKNQICVGLPRMYEGLIRSLQEVYAEATSTLPKKVSSDSSELVKAVTSFDQTKQEVTQQLDRGSQPNPSHHTKYIRSKLDKVLEDLKQYEE